MMDTPGEQVTLCLTSSLFVTWSVVAVQSSVRKCVYYKHLS